MNKKAGIVILCLLAACLLCSCSSKRKLEQELRSFAIDLMQDGAYTAAIAKFDEALTKSGGRMGPMELDILKYRAECEMLAGEYGAAEYTYSLLEENDKALPEYANLRVICMARGGGDAQDALKLYQKIDAQDHLSTGHREALYALGERLSSSGRESEAAQAAELYEKALEDESLRSGELYNRMAMLNYNKGDIDEAVKFFEEGLEYIRNSETGTEEATRKSIIFNLAVCYEETGHFEKALKQFKDYEASFGKDDASTHEIRFLEGILAEQASWK